MVSGFPGLLAREPRAAEHLAKRARAGCRPCACVGAAVPSKSTLRTLTSRAAASEGHGSERLFDKCSFAAFNLGLCRRLLCLDIGLEPGPDLARLQVAICGGTSDLGRNLRLRALAVFGHGLGRLLSCHADLFSILHLDLVCLRQHVCGL